jgi:Spy/CpxP family protein refolding chaperone
MKTIFTIVSAILFIAQVASAQPELEESKRERLEALKVAHITQELQLTPDEAQKFWPIYNEMTGKMRAIRKEQRGNRIEAKNSFDEMSDAEISAVIDREFQFEQEELNLKKEYNARFKKILPIRKVAKLHMAEKGFRKKLLRGARDHRNIPDGPRPH